MWCLRLPWDHRLSPDNETSSPHSSPLSVSHIQVSRHVGTGQRRGHYLERRFPERKILTNNPKPSDIATKKSIP